MYVYVLMKFIIQGQSDIEFASISCIMRKSEHEIFHREAKLGLKYDCYIDFSLNAKAFALLEVKVDLLYSKRTKCLD